MHVNSLILFVTTLLLFGCASSKPTSSEEQNTTPSTTAPMLANERWWSGLEGEVVYSWTSAQTMPMPVGGMKAIMERARYRIGGLDCLNDHERFTMAALVNADGDVVDTRMLSRPKNDACENLVRLAAFDVEWKPGSIDGEPVHAVFQFGFPTSFLR